MARGLLSNCCTVGKNCGAHPSLHSSEMQICCRRASMHTCTQQVVCCSSRSRVPAHVQYSLDRMNTSVYANPFIYTVNFISRG